ncbi:diguanylate cyclase [Thermodesulfatator indicus DSM 15286]|uniref:diguanylate cyclase n=1 Tax=Thermodesulfatator indicus (strain DSM 15286 / JCM 11887 / CIR29812) TaxID=667014 RepID=F8AA89_THEID|nr:GGDEF domain-containing protein [Thermodesulfatator indicus]AEH44225.1 diguanylate cyclase [Thermodesulfatator indicus DSM 15286]
MFEGAREEIVPKATEASGFEEKLKAERESLLAAWIAFLELQRAKKVPFPPQYADAFYAATKVKKKDNYILNLLIEGKGLFNSLLEKLDPHLAGRIGIAEEINKIANYIRRIEELEQELSFLKESFLRDKLTFLWNKNALEKFFYEVVIANIFEEDYLLCYFDLDKFKSINDKYGHKWGDRALIAFAEVLRRNLKPKDFPCRLHGDEFCAVIVGVTLDKFTSFAEELYEKGFAMKFPDGVHQIKFSIGLTNIIASDNLEKALERADFSMYWCKENGSLKPIRV